MRRLEEAAFQPQRTTSDLGPLQISGACNPWNFRICPGRNHAPTCERSLRLSLPTPPPACLLGAPLNLPWKTSVSCTVSRLTVTGHTHTPAIPAQLPARLPGSPGCAYYPERRQHHQTAVLDPEAEHCTRGPAPPQARAQAPHKRAPLIPQICANLKTIWTEAHDAPLPSPLLSGRTSGAIVAVSCGLKKELSSPQGH